MIDSRPDTYAHIHRVQELLLIAVQELQQRMITHDETKLVSPEKEAYDGLGERLREHAYGSEGYKSVLRDMKPAIRHHYQNTKHHPESYENGISDMSLVDLLELICDWKAASERQGAGDITPRETMDHNQKRFGFTDQVKQILLNTLDLIDPLPSQMVTAGDYLEGGIKSEVAVA